MWRNERRYRWLQTISGIIGSVALIYSVCYPDWYGGKGLWDTADVAQFSRAVETERVLGAIACMMAGTSICLCLLFLFCWDPETNAKSKMNPERTLHPGKLLLVLLMPTAIVYLIPWLSFTIRHKEQIKDDFTRLGYAYWMGIYSCFTLLVILPSIYLKEQCSLPEPAPIMNRTSVSSESECSLV
ncbi:uncharacterized protein si:ch211-256a21.4 [Hypanus sabinus]|uniref:uncharacterized protein si:ch211-256a21.4 n=1 Tax=Hypanus sabinus TaxID=79690 RepID=UPI0028C4DC69|nr:uncharacterized protein si:ch211-256a21.4 [Hypanus sabinus]